jgi:hypothetical protein
VPIRLYVSGADLEATVVNSHHCQAWMRSRGPTLQFALGLVGGRIRVRGWGGDGCHAGCR